MKNLTQPANPKAVACTAFSVTSATTVTSSESSAMEVRRTWMQMMGFTDCEIQEECRIDPPIDLDEEIEQYNAMFDIQEHNCRRR